MMRILLVDDDPSIRELLRDLLESRGHAVVEATNLEDAKNLILSNVIEVALVDGQFPATAAVRCPGDHGREMCKFARAFGVRTILISGETDLVEAEERAGWPALAKPFDLRAILAAVHPIGATA